MALFLGGYSYSFTTDCGNLYGKADFFSLISVSLIVMAELVQKIITHYHIIIDMIAFEQLASNWQKMVGAKSVFL
jgi:hypothetical protein